MATLSDALYKLIYTPEARDIQRFTQDSPILATVWLKYVENLSLETPVRVLLTPHNRAEFNDIVPALIRVLHLEPGDSRTPIAIESQILAEVSFRELLALLCVTDWWRQVAKQAGDVRGQDIFRNLLEFTRYILHANTANTANTPGRQESRPAFALSQQPLLGMMRTAAGVAWAATHDAVPPRNEDEWADAVRVFMEEYWQHVAAEPYLETVTTPLIWRISEDRLAHPTMYRSCQTVKGDAARRLFNMGGEGITWAVIDGGIDATHPAFGRYQPGQVAGIQPIEATHSRVTRSFDFTRLEFLLRTANTAVVANSVFDTLPVQERNRIQAELRRRLLEGRLVDWATLAPLLEISHGSYVAPLLDHGTHVAGILGANWQLDAGSRNAVGLDEDVELVGMCPNIEMYDIRVFSPDAETFEFQVIAALQFVRWLNQGKTKRVVHGVNLSLSLIHDVRSYASGRTPVCEEANRLVESGRVVVVAAAGNAGYSEQLVSVSGIQQFVSATITDPGNAENVITVGSVHRTMPHAYGVSYFSSRGPTGDGRMKPDLVAPGEKILSSIRSGQFASMDGTSMAAPHVSGAAALLLSRRPELVDAPGAVKRLLCRTATPLGREKYFEGCGLLDVLRALQAE